jgi:hypothetical protein
MKIKSLLPGIVVVLLAAGAVWWLWRPQTYTLSNGAKLKLVAVTYGRHHDFPGDRNQSSAFDTTNDTLVVWIEQKYKGDNYPNYQLWAYDKSATACVGAFTRVFPRNSREIRRGDEMVGFRLDTFPRRQGKIYLRVQEWNQQSVRQAVKNGFVISNPARGHFPAWLPEPLPNTQEDGDLSVALNRLEIGAKMPYTRNPETQNDPMNKGVLAAFQIRQNGKTATNWQPVQVETSDATGNHITGWCNSHWENDEEVTLYQYGLWPDEPAWKLRFEFSRMSAFTYSESWMVQNVPLEPGSEMDFLDLVEDFLQYLRHERGESDNTAKTYAALLGHFTAWAAEQGITDWKAVGLNHLMAYLLHERTRPLADEPRESKQRLSSESVYLEIAALRAFYRFTENEKLLPANIAENLSLPRRWKRLPKALSNAKLTSCSNRKRPKRRKICATRPFWNWPTPPACACRN